MREIKFRAWDGWKMFYADDPKNHRGFHVDNGVVKATYIDGQANEIEATLMQFTGLTDKNGVEIYEGDILDFDETEWSNFKPEVVTMEKLIGQYDLCGSLSDLCVYRQVIGNIHENTELAGV